MSEINLLPWREAKREREKKEFAIFAGIGLGIALVLVFLINMYANNLIEYQTQRNRLLEEEITRLTRQIKEIKELKKVRSALIARMNIVKNLLASRVLTPRLLDELVKIMPNGIYLTEVKRENNKVTLTGYSESNSMISRLMRNIEGTKWFQSPKLSEIKKSKEKQTQSEKTFQLSFIVGPKTNGFFNGQIKLK